MKSFDTAESLAHACSHAERSLLPASSKVEGHALRASSDALRSTLNAQRAFTLLELLVVMVVMVIILTISLPAFINIGRGMSLRMAANNVSATLALTRQWAITHREEVTFVGSTTGLNDNACFYVIAFGAVTNVIQTVTDLPADITFDASSEMNLTFKTDGGLTTGSAPKNVILSDKRNANVTMTISINGLTGGIKVE